MSFFAKSVIVMVCSGSSVNWCPFLLKVSLVMVCSGSSVNWCPFFAKSVISYGL